MALTQISTNGIKDANINTADIANDAVTSAKIADGTIVAANIANDTITAVQLANNSADINVIVDGAVSTSKIADQAVTLAKLPHGTSSNDGKFLRANNGADPTFETITGTTINNNADNRVITGSGTANTLESEANLTFTSDVLQVSSTTQGLGAKFINTGNEYTNLQFSAARTGADQALGIINAKWDNNHEVAAIYITAGNDTTNKDDGKIKFFTSAASGSIAERVRIDSDGLKFNGDTAAANALDDYEEGTWTPAISGVSYNDAQGHYVKIGTTCFVALTLNDANTSKTGDTRITGLPFTPKVESGEYYPANSIPFFEVSSISLASGYNNIYGRIDDSQGNIQLLVSDGESHNTLAGGSGTTLNSGHNLRTTFTYQTGS